MATIYQPLDASKRQIRLVRPNLITGFDCDAQCLVEACELRVFSLDDKPQYKALSYHWGRNEAICPILLNDERFYVRPNLHAVLQLLREEQERDLLDPDRCMWIFVDAICIDQRDLDERSSQVGLMGDVYRGATEVIAWLGHGGDDLAQDVREHVNAYGFLDDPGAWQARFDGIRVALVYSAARRLVAGKQPRADAVAEWFESLGQDMVQAMVTPLVRQPFWSRLWIVQEVVLAQRLVIWYRTLRVPWEVLYESLKYAYSSIIQPTQHNQDLGQLVASKTWVSTLKHERFTVEVYLLLLKKVHLCDEARGQGIALSSAITAFVGQDCTNRLDKVYGLLGMTPSVLKPDYKKSVDLVYCAALLEGLLEIQSRREEEGRMGWDASLFTVTLAKALGLDIHDRQTCFHMTEICLKLVGLDFQPTGKLWAGMHRLNSHLFAKFGAIGKILYRKIPALMHRGAALEVSMLGAMDVFWPGGNAFEQMESGLKTLYTAICQERFGKDVPYETLALEIKQLPNLTPARAGGGDRLAPGPRQGGGGLRIALSALRPSTDAYDQAHGRRLATYTDTLESYLASAEHHLASPDTPTRRSAPSVAPKSIASDQRCRDVRTILDFLSDPDFATLIRQAFHSDPAVDKMELFMYLVTRDFDAEFQTLERLGYRLGQTYFRSFLSRATNMTVVHGEIRMRDDGDPAYQAF
ncbi:hypothetical protein LTR53_016721 [Teratosphaeriaceae sp. CCFEE 6253]|nr:hypothetical protein LTR53_016721 [Teratosphaeriaceae sp. CCFEE 6253]